MRLSNGELLIVATGILLDDPISLYGKRWEIETLFCCLKSKNFNFENAHIIRLDRIEKLIALLSVAFCWAHKIGEWRHEERKIKKHGQKAQSYFRYGLDYVRDILLNETHKKLSGILFFRGGSGREGSVYMIFCPIQRRYMQGCL